MLALRLGELSEPAIVTCEFGNYKVSAFGPCVGSDVLRVVHIRQGLDPLEPFCVEFACRILSFSNSGLKQRNMCNIFQIQLRIGLLIATFGLVVSCLITNCPRGGKRTESDHQVTSNAYSESNPTDCVTCGPEGQGVCLGRNICCGKEIGCHTSLPYVKACRSLRTFKSSCLSELIYHTCGERGQCRGKYLCCSEGQCVWDLSCRSVPMIKFRDLVDMPVTAMNSYAFSPSLQKSSLSKDVADTVQGDIWKSRIYFTPLTSDYDS